MIETADVEVTRAAYDGVAERYAELFKRQLTGNPFDRSMLSVFAESVRDSGAGPVADLGCGPGRVTAYLAAAGLDMFGIDLSPEMVRLAGQAHPGMRFEVGTMERLDVADGTLAGIVAWYSLIHLPPERMPAVLAEFARVVHRGGHALFAFQAADEPTGVTEYAHKVAPAYRWSAETFSELLSDSGFRVSATLSREARADEYTPQACLLAVRS